MKRLPRMGAQVEQNNTYECPVCHKDAMDKYAHDDLLRIMYRGNDKVLHWTHNPGGAEITFEKKGRVQIGSQCNHCDLDKVKQFLGVI